MTKLEALKLIENDYYSHSYVTDETREKIKDIAIGDKLWKEAMYRGEKRRNQVYLSHGYWEKQEAVEKLRQKIVRALSCGDTLQEPENKDLLKQYHKDKTALKKLSEKLHNQLKGDT